MDTVLLAFLTLSATLQMQIEQNRPGIDHDYAVAIAGETAKLCEKYKVDCHLVVAIMAQESMYKLDAIGGGVDFGIMQVSSYNIKAHKLSKERLLTDLAYSIEAGIKILAYFQKRYKATEVKWWGRYNVGTGVLGPNRRALRDKYVANVLRYYPKGKALKVWREGAQVKAKTLINLKLNPFSKK